MKERINYETYEKPTDFLKLKDGLNTIRIISEGYLVKKHQFTTGGRFVSVECNEESCELCKKGAEAKIRYMWVALNRLTGKVKILEVGPMIGDEVCKLGRHEDIRTFDVNINKSRKKEGNRDKVTYTVSKNSNGNPITEEEKALAQNQINRMKTKYLS